MNDMLVNSDVFLLFNMICFMQQYGFLYTPMHILRHQYTKAQEIN
jgi:hypothetical protein